MEMTAIKRRVFTHSSLEAGGDIPYRATQYRATQESSKVPQEAEGQRGHELYCGFHRTEWERLGEQVQDGLL
jgi:hypothetical protein